VLIDDLLRATKAHARESGRLTPDLFGDFNGIPQGVDRTEFYQHDQNWSNRMIFGDSLQVMASLAERGGLRGKVQCIYLDPPYGIEFKSNFQWSTTSADVNDGNAGHITRERVLAQISTGLRKAGDFRGPAVPSRHGDDSLRHCFDLRLPFSQPRLAGT
jgi:hypothetical protein